MTCADIDCKDLVPAVGTAGPGPHLEGFVQFVVMQQVVGILPHITRQVHLALLEPRAQVICGKTKSRHIQHAAIAEYVPLRVINIRQNAELHPWPCTRSVQRDVYKM